ncbi:MAG: hypothetical protein L3J09_07555 [Flavobacteriaceae bacterium]|nr:hypothetical protein [Flavobacteriaceae bacterium]
MNKDIVLIFRKGFEDNCYQLLIDAYNKIISDKINVSILDEDDISALLNNNIELNPKSIEWKIDSKTEYYIFKDNLVIKKGFAKKQSRIDFVFSVFTLESKFKYFIEAKKLKEKNDSGLKRRYINTGIDNFVTKKYENGSLVGYLVEGDLNNTVQGINELLKKDNRNSECLAGKKLHNHKYYYESEHKEIGILKHLIFNFSKN